MRNTTHHFIEIIHLRVNRQFLPGLQDLPVLRRVGLFGEWVDIMFLQLQMSIGFTQLDAYIPMPSGLGLR